MNDDAKIMTVISILFLISLVLIFNLTPTESSREGIFSSEEYQEIQRMIDEDRQEEAPFALPTKLSKQYYTFEVTAYCPNSCCCGKYSDGVTSTGKSAYTKGVAVDPSVIPYGTKLQIPGYGSVIADDCGGAIKGMRLDVRFLTHQQALKWGRKILRVVVIKEK